MVNNLLQSLIFSPLDQFGEDESAQNLLQALLSGVLGGVEVHNNLFAHLSYHFELVYGVLDPAFFEGVLTGLLSTYAVDDDDCEDSE
jgi:hypothetical protein